MSNENAKTSNRSLGYISTGNVAPCTGTITISGTDIGNGGYTWSTPLTSNLVYPAVKSVVFNPPYTIVNWKDKTKTLVRCADDEKFIEEVGFLAALAKKIYGSRGAYLKFVEEAHRQIPIEKLIRKIRKGFKSTGLGG